MKPEFTEAVWCCTFHGLLGLHTLKRYVAVGSPKGVFVNFPFETEVPLEAGREKVRVRIRGIDSRPDRIRFSVDLSGGIVAGKYPEVFVRKPGWVSSVSASDGEGKAIRFREKDGYLRFSSTRKSGGPVVISFNSTQRLEDRRMRPVKLGPGKPNQLRGVTLSLGPCLLFANGASPRPVLVAGMRADGSLNLVPDRNGSVEMARAANLNLAGSEFERLRASPDRLLLSPWEQVNHREPVAFVYDLMLFP
jgi:hypothetical protein